MLYNFQRNSILPIRPYAAGFSVWCRYFIRSLYYYKWWKWHKLKHIHNHNSTTWHRIGKSLSNNNKKERHTANKSIFLSFSFSFSLSHFFNILNCEQTNKQTNERKKKETEMNYIPLTSIASASSQKEFSNEIKSVRNRHRLVLYAVYAGGAAATAVVAVATISWTI